MFGNHCLLNADDRLQNLHIAFDIVKCFTGCCLITTFNLRFNQSFCIDDIFATQHNKFHASWETINFLRQFQRYRRQIEILLIPKFTMSIGKVAQLSPRLPPKNTDIPLVSLNKTAETRGADIPLVSHDKTGAEISHTPNLLNHFVSRAFQKSSVTDAFI